MRLDRAVATVVLVLTAATASAQTRLVAAVPVATLIPRTAASHPFGAADTMQQPLRLDTRGYVEEEYAVSGVAQVYGWNSDGTVSVRHRDLPYATRILVRRPADPRRFSGTVLVDIGNRGAGFDTFAVWGQLASHLLAHGHGYVAVTVFANNIGALRMFDRARYAALSFPPPPQACGPARRDAWNRPAEGFPPAEDAIRWDVISQVGALLRTGKASGPFAGYDVQRVYGSMQSGGDLPTYVNAFSRSVQLADGRRVYDAFLIKDSGGPRIPLNDCDRPLADGDPRRVIHDAGVPVVQIVTENSVSATIRRPDSDVSGDQFRLYEVPGASHFDRWQYNYPRIEDLAAAGVPPLTDRWTFPTECRPAGVAMNDFPLPLIFAGAFANLDAWVRRGIVPPRAPRMAMDGETLAVDEVGNARGGLRSPWVDVPVAAFHSRMEGGGDTPFRCDDNGYWEPLPAARLTAMYGSARAYAERFRKALAQMVTDHWVTREDAEDVKEPRTW